MRNCRRRYGAAWIGGSSPATAREDAWLALNKAGPHEAKIYFWRVNIFQIASSNFQIAWTSSGLMKPNINLLVENMPYGVL
jgi:hypothetical protein